MAVCLRAEFGYALHAIAKNFIQCYGPQRRILLCAMGHSADSLSAMGHSVQSHELHFKACLTLKGIVRQKLYIYKLHYPRPISPMLEILPSLAKKLILRYGPLRRMIFKLEYLGKFEVEFETAFGYESVN
jgi:hypothetical protein